MRLNNPYKNLTNQWYRGNLHIHTTASDGKLPTEEIIAKYKDAGYDFVSVTDHGKLTDASHLTTNEFLVINGEELSNPHVLAIGITSEITDGPFFNGHIDPLSLQEEIRAIRKQNGLPIVAHPYWSGITSEILKKIKEDYLIEIYNAICDIEWQKGYSTSIWDELLSEARTVYGIAVDDCHYIMSGQDFSRAWIMVNTNKLTWETLSKAILSGRFYSTQGPLIKSIKVRSNRVQINCTPCSSIAFIGRSFFGSVAYKVDAPLTFAEYEIQSTSDQGYLRIVCRDESGKYAWSNPITL